MEYLSSTPNSFFISLGIIVIFLIALVFVLITISKAIASILKNTRNVLARKRLHKAGVFYAGTSVPPRRQKTAKKFVKQTIPGQFMRSEIDWSQYEEPVLSNSKRLMAFLERSKDRHAKRREILGSDNCIVIPSQDALTEKSSPELAASQVADVMKSSDDSDSNYIKSMRSALDNAYNNAAQDDQEYPDFLKAQAC